VLVDWYLRPANKKQVWYQSNADQVWEYLDWAFLRQNSFLHDLMNPVHTVREISDKNYWAQKVYLDLLILTFDIAEDAGMLPTVLH
jgi:hypothetical protein